MPDGLSGEEQAIYFSKVRNFFESYACSRVMGRGKKMSDYIERQAVIDTVAFGITTAKAINIETGESRDLFAKENEELRRAIKRIHDLPSADVVQVRHGKWTHKPDVYGVVYCSECDYELHTNSTSYCPNCGARMDGGKNG